MTVNPFNLHWEINGHFLLNCNCDVFCNCPVSLGRAIPNSANGKCFSWWGIIIEDGYAEEKWAGFNPLKKEAKGIIDLSGLNVAILLEVPGPLSMGGWTAGLYIDEKASQDAADALLKIFSGNAGGQTGWFSSMISKVSVSGVWSSVAPCDEPCVKLAASRAVTTNQSPTDAGIFSIVSSTRQTSVI